MASAMHPIVPASQAAGQLSVSQPGSGESRQFLVFTLDGETFAIDILPIREIIDYRQPTLVPMMPESIRGVINLRGMVVPVVDLAARFGRSLTAVARRTCIVILELAAEGEEGGLPQVLGVVVDAVTEVLDIAPGDIEPAPAFGARLRTDFIAGMGRVGGRFIVILDLFRVLSMDELAEPGSVAAALRAGRAELAAQA